ncbi:integrator complex subunit 13-like [Panonychus citri]|uniref:integrator complex subunit 13-like n=1 Tax=Panonychus citri TaxID=50023 RepID=UPI002307D491|nr:integrator complex subunit 13-like [Panonychus citri]
MFPISHKTVIVLDNSYRFLSTSCGQPIDYDVCLKMKGGAPPGIIPLAPLSKSLWTCSVEAIQEYSRIVYDVFPGSERLLSLVTCDEVGFKIVMGWNSEHQNIAHLNSCFARSSFHTRPSSSFSRGSEPIWTEDSTLSNGVKAAIEALGTPTVTQTQIRGKNPREANSGRVMLIACFKNENQLKYVSDFMADCLNRYNKAMREKDDPNRLPINECHLTIVNIYPVGDLSPSSQIREIANFYPSPILSCEIHSSRGGTMFALKLLSLVQSHYHLASTTVTGIPMKEEQNASSSANYDVEIVHPADAHVNLPKIATGAGGGDGSCHRIPKEDANYETIPLKWCTPRTTSVELHHCSSAYRISPVDVNSRPSSCLTNFLLSGRTVMLEMTKLKGSKVMSHMLSSHNGELYIHTLYTGRSLLEDPPSISEGIGGRITDYRINDFGELMKRIKLSPIKPSMISSEKTVSPIDKAMGYLTRQTLYWPIVLGHSIMFNLQLHIAPLINLIPKDQLTVEDVNECKNAIYQIVKMESKGTSLVLPCVSARGKGPKKEELYKLLWRELDHYIEIYASTPQHKTILSTLRDLHVTSSNSDPNQSVKSEPMSPNRATSPSSGDKPINNSVIIPPLQQQSTLSSMPTFNVSGLKDESTMAWKELDAYNNMSEREKRELDEKSKPPAKRMRIPDIQSPSDSNSSASMVENRTNGSSSTVESKISNGSTSNQNLLSIWVNQLNSKSRKRQDLDGRSFKIAPLYVNLNHPIE